MYMSKNMTDRSVECRTGHAGRRGSRRRHSPQPMQNACHHHSDWTGAFNVGRAPRPVSIRHTTMITCTGSHSTAYYWVDPGVDPKMSTWLQVEWSRFFWAQQTPSRIYKYTKSNFWSWFVQVNLNWLWMQTSQNLHIHNSLSTWFHIKRNSISHIHTIFPRPQCCDAPVVYYSMLLHHRYSIRLLNIEKVIAKVCSL